MLLAGVSAKKEGTAGAIITASPSPTFDVLLLEENGAVGTKLLNGSLFVLTGLFNKVNKFKIPAEEDTKKMIKSFGGEVKESFSVNTSKCTPWPSHFKSIVNLFRCIIVRISTRRKECGYR